MHKMTVKFLFFNDVVVINLTTVLLVFIIVSCPTSLISVKKGGLAIDYSIARDQPGGYHEHLQPPQGLLG